MSQRAMRKPTLLIIVLLPLSLLLVYAVSYSIRLRNHGKYDRTISMLTQWADRYGQDHTLQLPASDAWGRNLMVTTNNEQMVIVSKGVDVSSESDDIVLTVNMEFGSYHISGSYDSKHYATGVFY